jgi:Protein of unknown function (DUF3015)
MKKWQYAVVALVLLSSQVALAGRMGDAWKGSQSRIHGRFSKKGKGGGGAMALLMTSSTTITSLSTTALTSGGDMLKEVAYRDEFINENLYAIKVDSAKGQGEYLQTLATLSGCEGHEAQSKFGTEIRAHFDDVYDGSSDQDPGAIADQIDGLIQANPEMQKSCHLIGMNLASK